MFTDPALIYGCESYMTFWFLIWAYLYNHSCLQRDLATLLFLKIVLYIHFSDHCEDLKQKQTTVMFCLFLRLPKYNESVHKQAEHEVY
jgi:hypothetical protein